MEEGTFYSKSRSRLKRALAVGLFGAVLGSAYLPVYALMKRESEQASLEEMVLEDSKKEGIWTKLDEGLFLTQLTPKVKSKYGDSKITVLKINPKNYSFNMMSASEYGGSLLTAKEWAEKYDLAAVVNAGMFDEDYLSNVGFMQNYSHVNNPNFKKGYNAILAFNPKSNGVPQVQIIDPKCQDFNKLKDKYNSFSQSLRMVDCKQKNTWSQQSKMWSTAALGMDKEGNVLFVHSRSPFTVHDFIDNLLSAQIDIRNTMYLEGGPEASLYINLPNGKLGLVGSYETGFNENDNNKKFWQLPNVIGIKKK